VKEETIIKKTELKVETALQEIELKEELNFSKIDKTILLQSRKLRLGSDSDKAFELKKFLKVTGFYEQEITDVTFDKYTLDALAAFLKSSGYEGLVEIA